MTSAAALRFKQTKDREHDIMHALLLALTPNYKAFIKVNKWKPSETLNNSAKFSDMTVSCKIHSSQPLVHSFCAVSIQFLSQSRWFESHLRPFAAHLYLLFTQSFL